MQNSLASVPRQTSFKEFITLFIQSLSFLTTVQARKCQLGRQSTVSLGKFRPRGNTVETTIAHLRDSRISSKGRRGSNFAREIAHASRTLYVQAPQVTPDFAED